MEHGKNQGEINQNKNNEVNLGNESYLTLGDGDFSYSLDLSRLLHARLKWSHHHKLRQQQQQQQQQQRKTKSTTSMTLSVKVGDDQTSKVESSSSSPDESSSTTKPEMVVPLTFNEMIKETSFAMQNAYDAGITRQSIRVLLPRDPSNADLGTYFENDAEVDSQNLVLSPPDETWQGGIMQLYRAASPTCQEILRRFSKGTAGVPPKLIEDRSIDESGVDGVGLWMTQQTNASEDVSCFVQPTQEIIDVIETICDQAGKRLVLLMNPQWRDVDDALDSASKNDGFLGNLASFLGGKGNSLKRLEEKGFVNVFTIEGYVCKGGNVKLMKRFDTMWNVFAENDSGTDYVYIGSAESRPNYQRVEKMLDDNGIALKYARDIGLAPKLE